MISHKHKCIFVHIPKAAGTSIEMAFLSDLDLDMQNRHALLLGENLNKTIEPRRVSHLLAKQYVEQHFISNEIFNTYFKFAFVRNPYDRLFSIYKYRSYSEYMSFDTFIKTKLALLFNSKTENFFFKTQYEYLYNHSNICLVDFIGKFENLESDFNFVKQKINNKNLILSHHNKSNTNIGLKRLFIVPLKIILDNSTWKHITIKKKGKKISKKSNDIILNFYQIDFDTFNYRPIDNNELSW